MTAQFAQPSTFDEAQYLQTVALKNRRFGLLLWRVANGMIFVFFIFANLLMRTVQATWPPAGIPKADVLVPTIFTVLLALSWIPTLTAQGAVRTEKQGRLVASTGAICAVGIAFLVGIGLMWRVLIPGNAYSSIFYVMLGFHALHVIAGMILFGYVYAQRAKFSKENFWAVEAASVFWQFVVLMWVFFYLVLYIF
jgi:cytochrome c oxidase subunit 3